MIIIIILFPCNEKININLNFHANNLTIDFLIYDHDFEYCVKFSSPSHFMNMAELLSKHLYGTVFYKVVL